MTQHIKLFTPGPGDVDDDVIASLAQPIIRHYGPQWMEIYTELQTLLKYVFQTQNDIFPVPGPASATMDMAIGSLLANGQKIIVGNNGFFSQRLEDISHAYGLDVVSFPAEAGAPLDPDGLRRLLRQHPDAQAVALVHHETSTTVMNPLQAIAEAAHEAGKLVVVDAVSSLAGVELPVDAWGIDLCVTATNKCLEALPGLGFVSVSPQAWELMDRQPAAGHGWYLNLRTWRRYAGEWNAWHPTPVTMPVHLVLAVLTSLRKIHQVGLEAHIAKYAAAGRAARLGLRSLGFEMFVADEYASPIVTGVKAQAQYDVAHMTRWLLEERRIAIGGGLGSLAGKIFRVGHLGKEASREYLLDFLFAMEEYLRSQGVLVSPGAALVGL